MSERLKIWKYGSPDVWKFGNCRLNVWKFGYFNVFKGILEISMSENSPIRWSKGLKV